MASIHNVNLPKGSFQNADSSPIPTWDGGTGLLRHLGAIVGNGVASLTIAARKHGHCAFIPWISTGGGGGGGSGCCGGGRRAKETAVAVSWAWPDAPRRCDPAGPARVVGWGQGGLEWRPSRSVLSLKTSSCTEVWLTQALLHSTWYWVWNKGLELVGLVNLKIVFHRVFHD